MTNKCKKMLVISSFFIAIFMLLIMPKANAEKYVMTYLYGTSDYTALIKERGNALNEVSPSYFDITSDGNLKINYIDKSFVKEMQNKGIKVVPFFSNHWDRAVGRKSLQNYEKLSTQITNAVVANGLDGVNLDVENLTEVDRQNYINLAKRLREKMPKDKSLVVSVAANPYWSNTGWQGSYDYEKLGQYADYIMIMAYDEHYEGGTAGPVASFDFMENSIKYAIEKVPKEKVVLGIPLYGRYWNTSTNSGGKAASLKKIEEIVKKYSSKITYDAKSKSVKAVVNIKNSDSKPKLNGETLVGEYVFWYENENTVDSKLSLIEKYDIKGVGMWKAGLESISFWNSILNKINQIDEKLKYIFDDVKTTDWYYENVKYVYESGLMIGKNKSEFWPEESLTRAELVTIVARILGEDGNTKSGKNNSFSDISGHWAEKDIVKMKKYGIVNGYEDGTFKPNNTVTRAETAAVILRLIEVIEKNENITGKFNDVDTYKMSSYTDVSANHWAYKEISKLQEKGIINGYEDGSFKPANPVKRAEIAKILQVMEVK